MSSAAALALTLTLIFINSFSGHCYPSPADPSPPADSSPPVDSSRPLHVGFYEGKCLLFDVESIVSTVVKTMFLADPTIAPALMRMQFHDCFVHVSHIFK